MTHLPAARLIQILGLLSIAAPAIAQTKLTFETKTINLKLEGGSHAGQLLVNGTGVKADAAGKIEVKQAGDAKGLTIAFGEARQLQGGAERFWDVPLTVTGMPANYEAAGLRASLALDGEPAGIAEYALSTRNQTPFEWHAMPPEKVVVLDGGAPNVSFILRTVAGRASDVRVAESSLKTISTAAIETSSITLVDPDAAGDATGDRVEVPAGVSKGLALKLDQPTHPGKYEGAVRFTTPEASAPLELKLTVYATSLAHKLFGVGLIILGALVFLLTAVYFKNRRVRLDALLIAAGLRERAEGHEKTRAEVAPKSAHGLPISKAFIGKVAAETSEAHLDRNGLIPRSLSPKAFDADPLKNHLGDLGKRLALLDIVVAFGMRRAVTLATTAPDLETALKALDELVEKGDPDDLGAVRTEVGVILSAIPAAGMSGVTAGGRPLAPQPTPQQILMNIERLNIWTWTVWLGLTVVTGWSALILANQGFGTAEDLAKCFFWGLGVLGATGGLSAITRGTVEEKIQITFP